MFPTNTCFGLLIQGEEVTFDYNYVRVFGAAAKKCVCGSPHCRGYIGGDLLNAEVIVQDDSDDDYPEPVVFCEDGDMGDELNNIISARSSFNVAEIRTKETPKNKYKLDEPVTGNLENSTQTHIGDIMEHENTKMANSAAVFSFKINEEINKFHNESPSSSLKKLESSEAIEGLEILLHSSVQHAGNSLPSEDMIIETISEVKKECLDAEKVSSTLDMAFPSPNAMLSKSLRKKSGNGGASNESSKSSRRSSSVKKGKSKNSAVNLTSLSDMDNKLQIPQPKFRKPPYDSSNARAEAGISFLSRLWYL